MVHGLCFTGLAHRLMLDNPAAESCFRKALRIAKRSGGSHSYTARLASSVLGELLYERGDLDEAEPAAGRGLQARARGRLGRLQDRPIRDRRQDQGAAG